MNERIRELAEQAAGTRKHVPPVWQFFDDELEKFAQLIVRECADRILDLGDANPDIKFGSLVASEVIRMYFGVKE